MCIRDRVDELVELDGRTWRFIDTAGRLLDGDDDGTPGGDHLATFTIAGPLPRILSLPDVVRGPGQAIDLPATSSGIPIRLSDGDGVESLEFTLVYDPALLTITDVLRSASLPADALLAFNVNVPGQLRVALSFITPLNAGEQDIVTLLAAVPETATYGAKQVLDLTDVSINEGDVAVSADDAVHVVAYFGDTSGDGAYSALDGQHVLRYVVRRDSGFAAYPLADPVLLGDITGNGAVTALDATRISQEVSYLTGTSTVDRPEIPPIPTGIGPLSFSGASQRVDIPVNASAEPADLVTVPVRIDTAALVRKAVEPAMLVLAALSPLSKPLLQLPLAMVDGGSVAPTAAASPARAPAIDLAGRFSVPTSVSKALAADSKSKLWLKNYLGNTGRPTASPNAGLKLTIPAAPALSAASSGVRT